MKILFIGDVVGKPGRRVVKKYLPELIKEHQIDVTIVNGENAAHGKGITRKLYDELRRAGADVITLGNHAFSKRELLDDLADLEYLVRPINLIPTDIGISTKVLEVKGMTLAISSVMGDVFMDNVYESPYDAMNTILDTVEADCHLVDFHGEATAEKQTFVHLFKEYCVAIIGTHTHVQTADESIFDGCAYISDVGMCGVIESILGRDIDEVIDRTIHGIKTHYTIANGPAMLNGLIIEVENGRATSVERLNIRETSK
ncbi:MAG: YmdB family metallophosphoesterase [Erysipelothrix sp.]|nr:YmdB family metallophosphoesterase [Erysipelothrix sp.]